MEEKGLVKRKEGFFSKITIFFKKQFLKNKSKIIVTNNIDEDLPVSYKENTQEDISESLKELVVDGLTKKMKDEIEEEKIDSFMNKIGNDRDELRKLDMDTLKKINKHYDKKIEMLKTKLNAS